MKKALKCILSVMMSLIMMISALPLVGLDIGIKAEAKTISDYSTGDIIEFGSYPQSKVTDTSLISSLNSLSKTWVSYGYYTGTGDWDDGQMKPGDWMKYADITYGGNKYRAVTFSQYRPYYTGYTSSANNSDQDNNGYNTNTVYWFKYEPLKWRVLDAEEGLVMCESIIDSQAYNNTLYCNYTILDSENPRYAFVQDSLSTTFANDYATSSIREWLNDDFYNTAFTKKEKTEISITTLDNNCFNSIFSDMDGVTTNDKIFLLSYDVVTNSEYGFSSHKSQMSQGTDYAKSQGLYAYPGGSYDGNSNWWLRSPGPYSRHACYVSYSGGYTYDDLVTLIGKGVRPALKFNLKSEISQSENVFPDGYDFEEDSYSFKNYGTILGLSKKYFTTIYEDSPGELLYKKKKWVSNDGLCFGMAYTTAAIYNGLPAATSIFNKNIIADNQYRNIIREIKKTDKLYINDMEISVDDYIKYAFIYQWSQESRRDIDLSEFVEGTIEADMLGVVLCMYRNDDTGHAVLLVGYGQNDEGNLIFYVDDPNNTEELQTIEFSDDGWEFSNPWSGTVDSTNSTLGAFFDVHEPYRILSTGNKATVLEGVLDENSNAITETYIENMDRVNSDKVLLYVDSEKCSIDCDDMYEVGRIDYTGSDNAAAEENGEFYWINGDKTVTVSDFTSEDNEVSLAGDNTIITCNIANDSEATMTIDENEIGAEVNTQIGEEYSLSFETVQNDVNVGLTFSGTADSEEITATETEEGIVLTGVERGTVTLTVDEEVTKTETFDNARGQVEVKYDKTDAETDVEIDYISYLRLLNATASSENGEIIITANDDAEKAGIYPTTESGEAVSLITESTPIKISASGTYYVNFADWHKAGNQTQTTMTIGEKQYPVKFVFPIDNDGHEYTSVVVPPTKAEQGYTKYTCTVCGDTYKDDYIDVLGFGVKGSIISFGDNSAEITFELIKLNEEEPLYTLTVEENSSEFSFEGVEAGSYILRASKENHVTREYEIEIDEDIELEIQLNLVGDLNGDGKINTVDVARANAHAKSMSTLTGYEFDCVDINGDVKVNTMDVARMNAHAKGVLSLW